LEQQPLNLLRLAGFQQIPGRLAVRVHDNQLMLQMRTENSQKPIVC